MGIEEDMYAQIMNLRRARSDDSKRIEALEAKLREALDRVEELEAALESRITEGPTGLVGDPQ